MQYIKDGKIKDGSKIIIHLDGKQIINPKKEQILADGWEEYITPEYKPTIEDYRRDKIKEILEFDSSQYINCFYVSNQEMWLDKATRVGLRLRFEAELNNCKTETILWYDGIQFPLELDVAVKMLEAIELYASACYDNTQYHLS